MRLEAGEGGAPNAADEDVLCSERRCIIMHPVKPTAGSNVGFSVGQAENVVLGEKLGAKTLLG